MWLVSTEGTVNDSGFQHGTWVQRLFKSTKRTIFRFSNTKPLYPNLHSLQTRQESSSCSHLWALQSNEFLHMCGHFFEKPFISSTTLRMAFCPFFGCMCHQHQASMPAALMALTEAQGMRTWRCLTSWGQGRVSTRHLRFSRLVAQDMKDVIIDQLPGGSWGVVDCGSLVALRGNQGSKWWTSEPPKNEFSEQLRWQIHGPFGKLLSRHQVGTS